MNDSLTNFLGEWELENYEHIVKYGNDAIPLVVCEDHLPTVRANKIFVILFAYLCTPICAVGIVGTIASVVLLTRKSKTKRVTRFFQILSAWDLVFLIASSGFYVYPAWKFKNMPTSGEFVQVHLALKPVLGVSRLAFTWVLLWLVVERHHAISRPIDHWLNHGTRRRQLPLILVNLGAILYHIPGIFELKIVRTLCMDMQITATEEIYTPVHLPHVAVTSFGRNKIYRLVYKLIAGLCLVHTGPVLAHLLLVAFLVFRLRRRFAFSSTRNRRQMVHKVTVAILILELKFLISSAIPAGLNILEAINLDYSDDSATKKISEFSNFITVLNAASNMLVYFSCLTILPASWVKGHRRRSSRIDLLRYRPVTTTATVRMGSVECSMC